MHYEFQYDVKSTCLRYRSELRHRTVWILSTATTTALIQGSNYMGTAAEMAAEQKAANISFVLEPHFQAKRYREFGS